MKRAFLPTIASLLLLCLLCGCSGTAGNSPQSGDANDGNRSVQPAGTDASELVADIATTQYFTDESVSKADIEKILTAGVNAPSSMNSQPWHFSAITDTAVLQQISDDMSGGMSFGGTPPSGTGEMPDGVQPPDGMQMPDGAQPPDGAQLPDGAQIPDGAQAPDSGVSMSKAGVADAPLAIVISCTEGNELSAGLACQNMSVEAQLLGYGTKILSSPTIALNGTKQTEYKELLGIPDD